MGSRCAKWYNWLMRVKLCENTPDISWRTSGRVKSTREGFKEELLLEQIHKDWADISQAEPGDEDGGSIFYTEGLVYAKIWGQGTNHTVHLWASPDCIHGGGFAHLTQLKALLEQKLLLLWLWCCCPQHQAHKPPSITTPWHTDDKCGLTNMFLAKNVMCSPFIRPCIIKHCF